MSQLEDLLRRTLDSLAERRRTPESTYRLQFHAGFTFKDAIESVPYLHDLGVTDCYASPYLTARPGSTHGYDVIDHNRINPELGGEEALLEWVGALSRNGMSHILDTVPNHAGVATNDNAWWNDVLEQGPASRYADYFDIAWRGWRPELDDKVLLPVLGGLYGNVLEKGELRLAIENGRPVICYYDRWFPISTESVKQTPQLDEGDLPALNGAPGQPGSFDALDSLLDKQFYRLAYWRTASDEINYRRFFDINDLAALRMEREEVFNATHALTFRLLASGELAGLRIDHPDGLYDPEQYFHRLQRHYVLARAEHLFQSDQKSSSLRWSDIESAVRDRIDAAFSKKPPEGWPLYVVAEKILAADEQLIGDWPVDGTSGYDFLNWVNGIFIDTGNEKGLTTAYEAFSGCQATFPDLAYQKKRLILKVSLASELNRLTHNLDRLAQKDRHWRDFTFAGLRRALREVISCFPVYRSYITDRGVPEADRPAIDSAIADAIRRNPGTEPAIFQFIRGTLLLEYSDRFTEADRAEQRRFVGKLQQLTAPVTAKGVEDTAFYSYNRLISLNEVGGDPDRFGIQPEALHQYFRARQAKWPRALSALTTHDTKRSEDARARINVLSEVPDEWAARVDRWSRLNERHRTTIGSSPAPDRNEEYMLYQALIGAWPLAGGTEAERACFVERMNEYMQKALREAKVHTTWTDPDANYETAARRFTNRILDPGESAAFLEDFAALQSRISHWGMLNSLSQTLLRLTAPGVPDTYQGTELWDFSLVDPDNRRPVDYRKRRKILEELRAEAQAAGTDRRKMVRDLLGNWQDGRVKLFATLQGLVCRRQNPGLFSGGEYLPLTPTGPRRDHVFAFARKLGEKFAVAIVPRMFTRLSSGGQPLPVGEAIWQDTRCSVGGIDVNTRLEDVVTGQTIGFETVDGVPSLRVASVLSDFPIALLVNRSAR